MIDILVPVLARPQNAAPLVDSIRTHTEAPYTILFLCSLGDTEEIEACRETGATVEIMSWPAGRSDYPKKMNYGFKLTHSEFVLMGADDVSFEKDWDTHALRVASETGVSVIGTNDCANKDVISGHFSTHALVRRSYVNEQGASMDGPGILVSESYDHNYCDRELCALAQSRETWAFAPESHVKHRHPCWGNATADSTYSKGKINARKDYQNFFTRSMGWNYAGLLPLEQDYIRRFKRRHRRLAR